MIYLTEEKVLAGTVFTEIWECPPPQIGQGYRVIKDWWDNELTERHIVEIQLNVHPDTPTPG